MQTTLGMTARFSMQMHTRKTRNASQAKSATGNPSDLFGSTRITKLAPLNSETPREVGEQLLGANTGN
jgi:hypothetical protein